MNNRQPLLSSEKRAAQCVVVGYEVTSYPDMVIKRTVSGVTTSFFGFSMHSVDSAVRRKGAWTLSGPKQPMRIWQRHLSLSLAKLDLRACKLTVRSATDALDSPYQWPAALARSIGIFFSNSRTPHRTVCFRPCVREERASGSQPTTCSRPATRV